jgi:protoporphyrin/coproporphyrin ferrochelatase
MNGLLLINLGTPDAPTTPAVRRYLREFLWDRRVLDINPIGRAALLYGVILPFRPRKSAKAYRAIWGQGVEAGVSPLLAWTRRLAEEVAPKLGDDWKVVWGMRYGNPSLASAIAELQHLPLKRLVICPLYPQYASSSTGSSLDKVMDLIRKLPAVPAVTVIRDFYRDPGFIQAVAEVARDHLAEFKPDHVLMSFHGLPERHVKATDHSGTHCLANKNCCDRIVAANEACYRAQSYATARLVAAELGLEDGTWSVAFQSRLGRIPWIRPYTDEVLTGLAKDGKRRLLVLTPSFVADCLETLEEIGIRAHEDFVAAGGEDLRAVPCVNAHPTWVSALVRLVRDNAGPDQ